MTTTTSPIKYDQYGDVLQTTAGPRCGNHPGITVRHADVASIRECYAITAEQVAEMRAELYAEGVMSWVAGGGSPADAGRYAAVYASGGKWDGGIGDRPLSTEKCEHGLSADLCEGPQHYPMDSYDD